MKLLPDKDTVRLDERLVGFIGVREWGLPSLCMPGKIFRSAKNETISCMVSRPETNFRFVRIETLSLKVVKAGEKQWLPKHWMDAIWTYVQAYPMSGYHLGPLLNITEKERCDFIRKLARDLLVDSDNIGCQLIANAIGGIAAYGWEPIQP